MGLGILRGLGIWHRAEGERKRIDLSSSGIPLNSENFGTTALGGIVANPPQFQKLET
jgi:hypothetical protein